MLIMAFGVMVIPLPAFAKDCEKTETVGKSSHPGVSREEFYANRTAAKKKIAKLEKLAFERAISDWHLKVQLKPGGYFPGWKHAVGRSAVCWYEGEENPPELEWGKADCTVRARACRLNAVAPTPQPVKPKPKCAANDFRCKALQFKYKPKLPNPQPGVRNKVIILQ